MLKCKLALGRLCLYSPLDVGGLAIECVIGPLVHHSRMIGCSPMMADKVLIKLFCLRDQCNSMSFLQMNVPGTWIFKVVSNIYVKLLRDLVKTIYLQIHEVQLIRNSLVQIPLICMGDAQTLIQSQMGLVYLKY